MGCEDEFSFVERVTGHLWCGETQVFWASQEKEGMKERKGVSSTEGQVCLLCVWLLRQRLEVNLLWRLSQPSCAHPQHTDGRASEPAPGGIQPHLPDQTQELL